MLAVLFCASVGRVSTLNEPFARNHESTACGPMVCATRNMVRYGLAATGFRFIMSCDEVPAEQFTYYNHHPPLVPVMMWLPSKWFGESPWVYRLPAAICSVLTSALLFVMLARKFSWPVGAAAAFIYTFCPFTWLFGDMPDVVGSHLVFFGLATIECYSRWSETGRRSWLVLACISWFLCVMCDWPAFFLIPLLAGHFVLTNPWRKWWRFLPFGVASVALLAALFLWLMNGGDKSILSQVTHRVNGKTDFGASIGFLDWLKMGVQHYMTTTITLPILLLAGVYLIWLIIIGLCRLPSVIRHDTTLLMLLWGLLHVVIGMQSSYQHLWVWTVLVPGLAAAAALGAYSICRLLPKQIPAFSMFYAGTGGILAIVFLISSYLTAKQLSENGLSWQSALFQGRTQFSRDPSIYTLEDLGIVIRSTVPPQQGVLTSDVSDVRTGSSEPALWFYADRQVRNGIRTVDQLDRSLAPGDYPLFYGFIQHGGPRPTWFIMPDQHHVECPELAATLDARYAHWLKDGFILYFFDMKPTHGSVPEVP